MPNNRSSSTEPTVKISPLGLACILIILLISAIYLVLMAESRHQVLASYLLFALVGAVVTFGFLGATGLVKEKNRQVGGSAAGFVIVLGMLLPFVNDPTTDIKGIIFLEKQPIESGEIYLLGPELLGNKRNLEERDQGQFEFKGVRGIGKKILLNIRVSGFIFKVHEMENTPGELLKVYLQLSELEKKITPKKTNKISEKDFKPIVNFSENRVAVFPFSISGDENNQDLSDGIANILSTKLDGSGDLQAVNFTSLSSYWTRLGENPLSSESAEKISKRFGAGQYITGSLVIFNRRLYISASLFRVGLIQEAIATTAKNGEKTDALNLIEKVAVDLLTQVGKSPGSQLKRVAGKTTSSFPALKEYLKGERLLRVLKPTDAVDAFKEAVKLDPEFALAHYGMTIAAAWTGNIGLWVKSSKKAEQYRNRLPHREKLLVEAWALYRKGLIKDAIQKYKAITGQYPDYVNAWYMLGEVLVHHSPLRGKSMKISKKAFKRTVQLEPQHAPALYHLAQIAALEKESPDIINRLTTEVIDFNPQGDRAFALTALRAYALGKTKLIKNLQPKLLSLKEKDIVFAIRNVGLYARNILGALKLSEGLVEDFRSKEIRNYGNTLMAQLEAARGRFKLAKKKLGHNSEWKGNPGIVYEALIKMAPFLELPQEQLTQIVNNLQDWNPENTPKDSRQEIFLRVHDGATEIIKVYLIGLAKARLGEFKVAEKHAANLFMNQNADDLGSFSRDLSRGIRAEIAIMRKDNIEALEILEGMEFSFHAQKTYWSPFYSRVRERFTFARVLRDQKKFEEANKWLESIAETNLFETMYLAPSRFAMGENFESLGRYKEGIKEYQLFLELWKESGPQVKSYIKKAKIRIEQLPAVPRQTLVDQTG